jgi:hypothetical protein
METRLPLTFTRLSKTALVDGAPPFQLRENALIADWLQLDCAKTKSGNLPAFV